MLFEEPPKRVFKAPREGGEDEEDEIVVFVPIIIIAIIVFFSFTVVCVITFINSKRVQERGISDSQFCFNFPSFLSQKEQVRAAEKRIIHAGTKLDEWCCRSNTTFFIVITY